MLCFHPELCESPWSPTQWFTSHGGTIATQRPAPGIIVRKSSTECRLGSNGNGKGMLMFLPLQPLSWEKEYIYIYTYVVCIYTVYASTLKNSKKKYISHFIQGYNMDKNHIQHLFFKKKSKMFFFLSVPHSATRR